MKIKKALICVCFFILMTSVKLNAGVMTINGFYQGKNLFVQNPLSDGEFCVVSVFLNNEKLISYPKVSVFEVNMSNLKMNESVSGKILYRNNCEPKILNEQVIKSKSRFEFTSVNVDIDAVNWSSKGEKMGSVFYLQRLSVSNEWEDLGKFDCKGNVSANFYSVPSEHCTGLNQYRLKFVEEDLIFYSKTVSFQLERTPITIYPRRVSDVLNFTTDKPIRYSVYSKEGVKLKEGKGTSVNCTDLKPDDHYTVVYDNQKKTFYKK